MKALAASADIISSLLTLQPSARSSPHSPWSAASSWTSRRSSRNSLGRAPSLKRRSPSGERRSLLSGEGQESQDEEDSSEEEQRASPAGSDHRHRGSLDREAKSSFDLPDTLQVPGLHRTASGRSSTSEHQDCNGKSASGRLARALGPDDPPLDGDDGDDEGNLVRFPWGISDPSPLILREGSLAQAAV